MPQLFLILEEGNNALLVRALGDIQPPRFASQGLLSTIASWCMESSGHELKVIASTNVRVVYRRFDNHLLFVLVTSNLLLQTELLQLHLETLYAALLLLLGSQILLLDTFSKSTLLKSKLRGPDVQRAVDSLIADDTLAPCITLPVPQFIGLPLRGKAVLQGALAKIIATLECQHASILSEGYYMASTHGWCTLLSPREQMLVQHLATQHAHHHPVDSPPELLVHVGKRHYEAPLRLRLLRLQEAVLLAVLFESGGASPPPLKDSEDKLRVHLLAATHTLETPLWLSSPVPQFSTITYDLALVVEHSPPSAVLLWGHSGTTLQQGFNPLVSPSVRKQMGSSTSPIATRLSYKSPPAVQREDSLTAGGDGLQLFFRSTLDTLVSFVLQTWPQMRPALQAVLQDGGAAGAAATAGNGAPGGSRPTQPQLSPAQLPPPSSIGSASSPFKSPEHQQQQQLAGQLVTPPRGGRGASPMSRLGLGAAIPAIRRISSSALSTSIPGANRLQALFGRSSSAAPDVLSGATVGAAGTDGEASGGAGAGGSDCQECGELAHVPYDEVHAVIDGARLLALLDRSRSPGPGSPAPGPGGAIEDVVDVFVAFPKRVSRLAALEAAVTLRATYLMAYHDE